MSHWHDTQRELVLLAREVRELDPDTWSAYGQLHRAALTEGELTVKVKELMALAIAITRECDGCIAAHARNAAKAGASPKEVAETIGVAVLMNGGPGTVYGPWAWEAYREFTAGPEQAAPPPSP